MKNANTKSPTFCPLLWSGLTINAHGVLRPCCRFDANDTNIEDLKASTLEKKYNSDFYQNIRASILKGERVAQCTRCYNEEASGIKSLRQQRIEQSSFENLDLKAHPDQVEYMEVFLGRECNLACLSCKPLLSTKWDSNMIELNGKLGELPKNFKTDTFNISCYKNLKEIKFVGGETFISDKHLKIIDTIPSQHRANVVLDYYTNGTLPIKEKWFKSWADFKKVIIRFSIDGHKDLNNYIRYPSKWNVIEKNIEDAIGTKREKVVFRVQTTISILNIFSYQYLATWWDSITNSCPNHTHEVKFNLLDKPSKLSIALLKDVNKDLYPSNLPSKWLSFIQKSNTKPQTLREFKSYIKAIDHIRKNNVSDYIPELKSILKSIN